MAEREEAVSFRQGTRDAAGFTGWWIFGLIIAILTMLILVATWTGVAPWVANAQREINQNTQQYQESQVRAMRDHISKYEDNAVELATLRSEDPEVNASVIDALERQQQGVVTFVEQHVNTLDPNAVPADIAAFVATH